MGDNKISEKPVAWYVFADTEHWVTMDEGEAEENREEGCQVRPLVFGDMDAHLQGEAVPVGYIEHSADKLSQMTMTPDGLALGVGRHPVYAHPQPAELNEVSGNSGELASLPAWWRKRAGPWDQVIKRSPETIAAATSLYECADELEAALASRHPVGKEPVWCGACWQHGVDHSQGCVRKTNQASTEEKIDGRDAGTGVGDAN